MTKLDKKDVDKVITFLKQTWKGRSCPMCQTGSWMIQDSCFQLMAYVDGAVFGGEVIPVIPVTCTFCFNTVLLNAIRLGIVKSKEKPTVEPSENGDK